MKNNYSFRKITGEYKKGEVVLYLGKVNSGKTKILVSEAVNELVRQKSVLFCSFEKKESLIEKDIKIALTAIKYKKEVSLITKQIGLGETNPIKKIDILIRSLKSNGKNIDVVFVDGIVCKTTDALPEYHLLKKLATELNVLLFINLQLSLNHFGGNFSEIAIKQLSENHIDYIYKFDKEEKKLSILKIKNKLSNIKLDASIDFENNRFYVSYNTQIDIDNYFYDFIENDFPLVYVMTDDIVLSNRILEQMAYVKMFRGKRVLYVNYHKLTSYFIENTKGFIGNVFFEDYNGEDILLFLKRFVQLYDIDSVIIPNEFKIFEDKNYEEITKIMKNLRSFAVKNKINIVLCGKARTIDGNIQINSAIQSKSKVIVADFVLSIENYKRRLFYKLFVEFSGNKLFILKDLKNREKTKYEKLLFKITPEEVITFVKKLKTI